VFNVVKAVVVELAEECESVGARFRVLLLPDGKSLALCASVGEERPWQPLFDELVTAGIAVVDLSAPLESAGARSDPSFWRPGGHYSRRANAIVAGELAPLLE
jgi:hypothetical protein